MKEYDRQFFDYFLEILKHENEIESLKEEDYAKF